MKYSRKVTHDIKMPDTYFELFRSKIRFLPSATPVYVKYENDNENVRFIPVSENWDTVNSLIEKSIEENTDLLWHRYQNNLIDEDAVL